MNTKYCRVNNNLEDSSLESTTIKKLVIAGGGTAGWLAAAALSKKLNGVVEVTLVESSLIDTVGVGEATIPPMRTFHKLIGINEQKFMRATHATFKLGIQFENWGQKGDKYIHAFGRTGVGSWLADFHQFWLKANKLGFGGDYGDYCLELKAAEASRFALTKDPEINYAYHLDAGLYGKFLRNFSENNGAKRVEGTITEVRKDPENGFISALVLDSGEVVEGDLFIDCTGFRGLLIEQALHTGYEEWGHWLPCDSAVAVQTESVEPAVPYTRSIAHEFGWQWRIPLQHRTGNGLVFCSRYVSDDDAKERLYSSIEGKVITEPRVIKYKTGRRRKGWNKNCIALGLSSGFLEPLESTSIHLFMTGITRLMQLFPHTGIQQKIVDEYNARLTLEMEQIRDFIILHYHVTERDDSPFWRHCRTMEIPETLQHRLQLFADTGHSYQTENELFRLDSWLQVMLGQRLKPRQYHPIVDAMSEEELRQFLATIQQKVDSSVEMLPAHQAFVQQYCDSSLNAM